MENEDELKEINIKNCACYYFDDAVQDININFCDILLDGKLYENISVYDISCKTFRPKPLRISFYKTEDFKMVLDVKNKCLFLYAYELFEKICDKIKYLISKKKKVLHIVVIIIFERLELIYVILYQSKKKVHIKINPIHNVFIEYLYIINAIFR